MVTIKPIAVITACMVVITSVLSIKGNLPFEEWGDERRAFTACMSVEDFIFISSVVEAESNRCTDLEKSLEYYQTRYQESREELVTVRARFGMKV